MSGYHDGSLQEQEERREKMREIQRRVDEILGPDARPAARAEMALRTADRPGSLAEMKRKEREHEARAGVKIVGIAMIILLVVILLVILGIVANLSAAQIAQDDTIAVGYMIVRVADYEDREGLNLTLWRPGEPFVGPPAELKRSAFSLWLRAEDGISARSPAFWIATAATIAGGILIYQLHLSMEGAQP